MVKKLNFLFSETSYIFTDQPPPLPPMASLKDQLNLSKQGWVKIIIFSQVQSFYWSQFISINLSNQGWLNFAKYWDHIGLPPMAFYVRGENPTILSQVRKGLKNQTSHLILGREPIDLNPSPPRLIDSDFMIY